MLGVLHRVPGVLHGVLGSGGSRARHPSRLRGRRGPLSNPPCRISRQTSRFGCLQWTVPSRGAGGGGGGAGNCQWASWSDSTHRGQGGGRDGRASHRRSGTRRRPAIFAVCKGPAGRRTAGPLQTRSGTPVGNARAHRTPSIPIRFPTTHPRALRAGALGHTRANPHTEPAQRKERPSQGRNGCDREPWYLGPLAP